MSLERQKLHIFLTEFLNPHSIKECLSFILCILFFVLLPFDQWRSYNYFLLHIPHTTHHFSVSLTATHRWGVSSSVACLLPRIQGENGNMVALLGEDTCTCLPPVTKSSCDILYQLPVLGGLSIYSRTLLVLFLRKRKLALVRVNWGEYFLQSRDGFSESLFASKVKQPYFNVDN